MTKELKILVIGASGQQGGSVARELLARGHQVVAMTRKFGSTAALELSRLGAEIVEGDLSDRESLIEVMQGVDGVFGVTTPYESGVEVEVEYGLNIIDAAEEAGIEHLVFSSIGKADKKTGIPHFDSKTEIEAYLRKSSVPHTIIGPVFFMENWLSPWFLPALQEGNVALAMPGGRKLAHISVGDIGRFAPLIFARREEFLGKRIDIATDNLSGYELADKIGRHTGRKLGFYEIPLEGMREQNEDFAKMFEWFDKVGYNVDIAELIYRYPEVGWTSFDYWLRRQDWSALDKGQAKAG
jgi:uncharacterized protein YbjT (DUF2867 family)